MMDKCVWVCEYVSTFLYFSEEGPVPQCPWEGQRTTLGSVLIFCFETRSLLLLFSHCGHQVN